MEQNGINNFASTILDFTTSIAKSKVDSAQYDKSFNTVIWGINQLFTDDVPQSVQEKLIKEHKIPEISENFFYTFAIDGNYYVKESDIKFKLYQNVVVRVPNGNWDKMYIEGNGNDKETSSSLKDIKISTGKIEYNGEVYRLQRGNDRKIIAVSQGKKCTRIYSSSEAESEAAAVSAVIHGLDEPWDIEFDYCMSNDGDSVTPFSAGGVYLKFSDRIDNSVITEVDYGDGSDTVTDYSGEHHTIEHKGYYHMRMRIKMTATKIVVFGGDFADHWDLCKEIDPKKWREGQHVYIGGNIQSVQELYGGSISHLTWGESVNYINNSALVGSKTSLGFIDVGLPPYFISSIENWDTPANGSHQILYESPVNYLYIPESCRRVFHIGFGGLPLKTLEIEPEGESLTLDPGAFLQYNISNLKVVSIPARVKFSTSTSAYSPFDGGGIRVLYLQRGIQEIASWSFINCYSSGLSIGNSAVIGKNGEVFVFIPKTVTSIGYASFSFGSVVNIVYEGSQTEWGKIAKEEFWIRDRKEPDNIVFGETYYNLFQTVVDNLRDKYMSGVGIEVSDVISLKPATKDTLGGVRAGESGSGIENASGKLSLKKADLSTFGGLQLGKGLHRSPDDSHSYGIVDANLGQGLSFDESSDPNDENYGKINVSLGKNLSFGENGEINATSGLEYIAGNGINISDTDIISLNPASKTMIGGVKAGKNVTIHDDGTIDVEGTGGAELEAGGGITIETDEETGTQKISAAVGEGAEIRDGKICTVPNIQNAVLITEADAKYLLHNFTQIEYNAGNKIGYAGAGNQIVVQGYLAYQTNYLKNGGRASGTYLYYYPHTWSKPFSTYAELSGVFYQMYGSGLNGPYKKISLSVMEVYADHITYGCPRWDENEIKSWWGGSIQNYNSWSDFGIAVEWTRIDPPGYTFSNKTFEYGCMRGHIYVVYDTLVGTNTNESALASKYAATSHYNQGEYLIPFASVAEYQAAVGLTYEPLTLMEVTDNPTMVSGKELE